MLRFLLLVVLSAACLVDLAFAQSPNSTATVDPRDAFRQAFEHYQNKQYAKAEQLFSSGLRASPKDAQAHFYLAESLLAQAKRAEAKTSFTHALRLGLPDSPKARATQMISILSRPPAPELATINGCRACHDVAKRKVGPSFGEIRARYANDPGAEALLVRRTLQGAMGTWGNVPMPANTKISQVDATAIVQWILNDEPIREQTKGADPPSASVAKSQDDLFFYFLQAGQFTTPEEAEEQRARLAILGFAVTTTTREQSGRAVYRVRLGPFETGKDMETARGKLASHGVEATLVRVVR